MTLNILPNAKTQFFDGNGNPLAAGFVYMYIPSTTTPKATYQDSLGTVANTNPIVLDANGEALIWGSGAYRQIVTDSLGNIMWDQVTLDPGYAVVSSFSGTSTTSVAIGTGAKSFTTQPGLQFFPGGNLIIASNASALNYMTGTVTSYNVSSGALVMNIVSTGGSGTFADWNISITGSPGAAGTVTSISVASANGFAGSSSGGGTPALTLSTTVTGVLKGNGTAISQATAGTDYLTPTGNGSGLTSLTAANISAGTAGISISGNAATVTTNANLTGPITSSGNATTIASGNTYPTPTFSGTATGQGLLDISGASAGQVKFPATQNASSNANTLDDYKEGTWTPVLRFNGNAVGMTYSVQLGTYTKIGNMVNVAAFIILSAKGSSTGQAEVIGIPYSPSNISQVGGVLTVTSGFTGLTSSPNFGLNVSTLYLWQTSSTGSVAVTDANFTNTTAFTFNFTYTI
jgi:hypothetical protein